MRVLIAAITLLAACSSAYGWGHPGHEAVGAIADQLLAENAPNASQQVTVILGGGSLRDAAGWADCVKDVAKQSDGTFEYHPMAQYHAACVVFETPDGIARMEDYVSRNFDNCHPPHGADPCHKQYHYTDVAIQHDEYSRTFVGTSDHDIVSALEAAIAVLQDKPAPAPFSIKDKKEALYLIAHLVGDLHQPLHVGAVYLKTNGARTNPDVGTFNHATETRGGNSIAVGSTNLHSKWDGISASIHPNAISAAMMDAARATPTTPGEVSTWPTVWASETIVASHGAFAGISFGAKTGSKWPANFSNPTTYSQKRSTLQKKQLAKGGARLAQVLIVVWPNEH